MLYTNIVGKVICYKKCVYKFKLSLCSRAAKVIAFFKKAKQQQQQTNTIKCINLLVCILFFMMFMFPYKKPNRLAINR